jgi:hypothetical protein
MDTFTYIPSTAANLARVGPVSARGGITFTILQSTDWQKEAMFDPSNTTYLYTKIRGDLVLEYNPSAASFVPGAAGPGSVPFVLPGQMPAQTEMTIRRFLEQPRGQVIATSAGFNWLVSPAQTANGRMKCDANNGPFIKVNSIRQIQGERLWIINIGVETFINETPATNATGLPPLILSNRWYAHDTTNAQALRVRVYQGVVTCRADVLQAQPNDASGNSTAYIDYFRDQFANFTVPIGFQRTSVDCTVTPDGLTCHYKVVDEEQLWSKGRLNPCCRIEMADTNWISLTKANNMLSQAMGLEWRLLDFISGENRAPELTRRAAVALSRIYKNIVVRVWGTQNTNRRTLVTYAMAAVIARMGVQAIIDTTLSEIIVTADTSNFVQVNFTIHWGPDVAQGFLGNLIGGAVVVADNVLFNGAIGPGQRAFSTSIGQSSTTTAGGFTHSQARAQNPPFPGSAFTHSLGVRGSAASYVQGPLVCLVTQALEQFDGQPASPTALPT